jgi:hypothetical protein
VRRRLPIGWSTSYGSLVKEFVTSQGYTQHALERTLFIMEKREVIRFSGQVRAPRSHHLTSLDAADHRFRRFPPSAPPSAPSCRRRSCTASASSDRSPLHWTHSIPLALPSPHSGYASPSPARTLLLLYCTLAPAPLSLRPCILSNTLTCSLVKDRFHPAARPKTLSRSLRAHVLTYLPSANPALHNGAQSVPRGRGRSPRQPGADADPPSTLSRLRPVFCPRPPRLEITARSFGVLDWWPLMAGPDSISRAGRRSDAAQTGTRPAFARYSRDL